MKTKVKFTKAQLTMLLRMRNHEIDQKVYCVSGKAVRTAVYLRHKGCLWFDGLGEHEGDHRVRLTERGKFVAEEQGGTLTNATQWNRYTFAAYALELLSDKEERQF